MTRRNRILISAIIFASLYTIVWFILAGQAETAIDQRLDVQKENGVIITNSGRSKSGFPFALKIKQTDFSLKTKDGLTIDAPIVTLGVGFTDWAHITIDTPAGVSLTIPAGKTRREIKAAITTATGWVDNNNLTLTLNAVTATGLIDGADPISAVMISLHGDRPDVPPADHTQPGGHAIVNADTIILPGAVIPGLGNNIKRLTLDATVMGKLPKLNESSLRAWNNDGGTVEVRELSTDWGKLGLGMGGTVALDPALQPIAAFDAKITGFTETLDALAATHAIKPSSAALASVGLGLLAKPEGPDNLPTVAVPLTIQNGQVFISSFKLVKMPPVRLY